MKVCTKCKTLKDFYCFSKNITKKDLLACWCKECVKGYKELTRKIIIDTRPVAKEGFKICITCNVEQEIENYHNSNSAKDGKVSSCKECVKIKGKEYVKSLTPIKISEKKCNICLEIRNVVFFNKDSKSKDGYRNGCKNCQYKDRLEKGLITGNTQTTQEKYIENFLIQNNIKYEKEVQFESCLSPVGSRLFFDFYLPDYKIIIEYNGPHHYLPIWGEETLKRTKLFDKIRFDFCLNNDYVLMILKDKEEEALCNKLFSYLLYF